MDSANSPSSCRCCKITSIIAGCFQVIAGIGVIILCVMILMFLSKMEHETFVHVTPVWVIIALFGGVHASMGGLLLHGCIRENPRKLQIWLVYMSIMVFIQVIGTGWGFVNDYRLEFLLAALANLLLNIAFIYAVHNFRGAILRILWSRKSSTVPIIKDGV